MPSLKAIRKRISSVKNTQKITRAMKLIAAARLRKSQDAIIAARPYAQALEKVVGELAFYAGRDAHPLLQERGKKSAMVIVITSDRGLAGSFNSQAIRRTEQLIRTDLAGYESVRLRVVGRKANAYFTRREAKIASFRPGPTGDGALDLSRATANEIVADFLADEAPVDRVFVVYNEFKSAISQKPVVKQLLPIDPPPVDAELERGGDFVYEPSKEALFSHLVPLYVQNSLFRAMLESIASEFGARMSAMDSATRNAGQMIDRLTLVYNRARQAAITKELLEIIAGAESLKG